MKILIYEGQSIVDNVNLSNYKKNIIGFGRNSDCDIVLKSKYVSGTHGCFTIEGNTCTIHDMDSKNGIKVNGQSVKERVLKDGDIIDVYPGGGDEGIRMEFMAEEKNDTPADKPKKKISLFVKIAIPVVVVLAALIIGVFVFRKKSNTPKGEFVAVIEGKYGTETDTITFYDGTYTLKQSIEHNDAYADEYGHEDTSGRNEEAYIGFGTYKVKNNKIYLYEISDIEWMDEDNKLDENDIIIGKYDRKSKDFTITQYGRSDFEIKLNTVQSFDTSKDTADIIFKENNKKAKTKVKIDDKYIRKLNSNIQEKAENSLKTIGIDNMFDQGGENLNIYIDKYNYDNGKSDFEKRFIYSLKELKDDKLESMINEGLINIHVVVYYNSPDNYTVTSDISSGTYNNAFSEESVQEEEYDEDEGNEDNDGDKDLVENSEDKKTTESNEDKKTTENSEDKKTTESNEDKTTENNEDKINTEDSENNETLESSEDEEYEGYDEDEEFIEYDEEE